MSSDLLHKQNGLALLGSLMLVSMLAVMSTAFLLLMAADVRIAQSHYLSTQAYYMATSATEIAAIEISNNPLIATPADSSVPILLKSTEKGEFAVYSFPSNPPDPNKRELRIRAISGKAWFDLYSEIYIPRQDPRTYFPIVAGNQLELGAGCRVEGGEGVWMMGSYPVIDKLFEFDSPSAGSGKLMVCGLLSWGAGGVAPELSSDLDVYTNAQAVNDIFPKLLYQEGSPYTYYVAGTPYQAKNLVPVNVSGPLPAPGVNNPMSIYVWDHDVDGTFSGNINLNGTLYCPGAGKLTFGNGDLTISPKQTFAGPTELYPAIISKGSVEISGSGARDITGLIYVADTFTSSPSDTLQISGSVIANAVLLQANTLISYNTDLFIMPASAFKSNTDHIYATISLHRRRFMDLP